MLSFGLTLARFFTAIYRSWSNPVFRSTLGLALLILLSGTLFYHSVEGWSWLDSLFFSVMTALTISYDDLTPSSPAARIFTMFYALVSIGVFIAIVLEFARALIKPEAPSILGEETDEEKSETQKG